MAIMLLSVLIRRDIAELDKTNSLSDIPLGRFNRALKILNQ